MLIDWFTVCAQLVNFLILVWLMKRFLYKPILSAVESREKKIAAEIAAANAKKADSQKEHDEYQSKNWQFDQDRAALMAKATAEAKAERERLIAEAGKAADDLKAKREELQRSNAVGINQELSRLACNEVFAITRRTLADLATTSLEERMGEVFARRLTEMDESAKKTLGDAMKTSGSPSVVKSAFDLPDSERAVIQRALNETFSTAAKLTFETAPELICGIELSANGQKISWSISDYLKSLQSDVDTLLASKALPGPVATASK